MIKGIPVTLADGKSYIIAPLRLGDLEDLQDAIARADGTLGKEAIAATIDVVTASLQRNYPKMKREEVRNLLDLENMQGVFAAAMDVSGAKRKALEAGEAKRPASRTRSRS